MGIDEMNQLARALWVVAGEEGEEAQVAVAWLARNQICKARLSVSESCAQLEALIGHGPCPKAPELPNFADTGFCRAFAVTCAVWSGGRADPTAGATLAHRHDEAPAWAERLRGTALIGPWMFYRPR
ncbi:MAG TPA: hypothetical protein VEH07_09210 [Alphaproteobacteria bacterium]|nr:hypothetical protein [Alphaproteobacteria bacterium]